MKRPDEEIDSSATCHMILDPDREFGLLSSEDQERLERILNERSEGLYGVFALHGMLTSSVVGPKTVPLDWIVPEVLGRPYPGGNTFNRFPEFSWASERIEELFLQISRIFQQNCSMFRLPVSRPKLKESDTMPDLRIWCLGFVKAMIYHQKGWEPLLSIAFPAVAPIVMMADPDGWRGNPYNDLAPSKLRGGLELAAQATHAFWPFYHACRGQVRASVVPSRNDPCPCSSGRKFKRCCGRIGESGCPDP